MQARYSSRLRFVDADDLDKSRVDFADLEVRSPAGETLGDVDGFILDLDARRPYYVVVDSGGWFSSRHFLLPIGHARLHDDYKALVVDVQKEDITRYPQYDSARFPELTDDELRAFENQTLSACCPDEYARGGTSTLSGYERWTHYRQPVWWTDDIYTWPSAPMAGTVAPTAAGAAVTSAELNDRVPPATARSADPSPHYGGRAQPGDVIGIETGGERTALGEDAQDENERREVAERENARLEREAREERQRELAKKR